MAMEVFDRIVLRRCPDKESALEHARGRRKRFGPMVIVERLSWSAKRRWAVVQLRALDLEDLPNDGWSE